MEAEWALTSKRLSTNMTETKEWPCIVGVIQSECDESLSEKVPEDVAH